MSSSLAAKSRALTARTVHLKLFPAPRNFNEQREVLRVLERFGEVTMFRFLKHRIISPVPNAFIATFASENSVADIINAGPIRYRLVPDSPPPETESQSQIQPELEPRTGETIYKPLLPTSSSSPSQPATSTPTEQPQEETESSTFELTISPSILSHGKYITSPHTNPLYGPYPPYPTHKSLVGSMLHKSVTSSMWAPGLRDWETDVERWRVGVGDERGVLGMGEEEDREGEGRRRVGKWGVGMGGDGESEWGLEGTPSSERAVYTRAVKRRREGIPKIMWGIRKFKQEVEREKEREKRDAGVD